jgi:hypothetical protein
MNSKYLALVTFFFFGALPIVTFANGEPLTGFSWLVGIPGLEGESNFNEYINALYALAISLAALIAVVKIIIAGAKYMMSDIVSSKSAAKEDIRNALIGLLIIIGAVIILNTVNSNLTNVNVNMPDQQLDDRDTSTTMPLDEALARGHCDNNNGCHVISCNSNAAALLGGDPSSSCESRCESPAVNGVFERRTTGSGSEQRDASICAIAGNSVAELVDEMYGELISEHCPAGESCYAVNCSKYSEGWVFNAYCADICNGDPVGTSDNLGGVHYDETTDACIFVGPIDQDETIPCVNRCGDEEVACADRGGIVMNTTSNPNTVTCRIPVRQDGSTTSGAASSTDQARIAPGIRIGPNTAYLVNDPSYVDENGVTQPAADNHAAVITFPETLRVQNGLVDVIINGQPTRIGCDNITPSVCT